MALGTALFFAKIGGFFSSAVKFLLETKVGNIILIALAVAVVVWWVDARAYDRGVADMVEKNEEARAQWEGRLDELEANISGDIMISLGRMSQAIEDIEITETTIIRPAMQEEINNAPSLSDGTCVLPDSLLAILNSSPGAESPNP